MEMHTVAQGIKQVIPLTKEVCDLVPSRSQILDADIMSALPHFQDCPEHEIVPIPVGSTAKEQSKALATIGFLAAGTCLPFWFTQIKQRGDTYGPLAFPSVIAAEICRNADRPIEQSV